MPLEDHRLLGGDGLAALIAPDASVEWWCTPRLDSSPALWRLLDDDGGVARWRDAKPLRTVGSPAGPCARSIVEVEGRSVSCWDGLVRLAGEPALVRLVRSVHEPVEVTHELTSAVFDPEVGAELLQVHTVDGSSHAGGDGLVRTSLSATTDRWRALVVQRGSAAAPPNDERTLRDALRAAEDRALARADASAVISSHRDRVRVSLHVLDACTDPSTGAVVAAPTTSVPEVIGADRNFDYRFAWVRDASLAASIAALLGQPRTTARHVEWLLQRCLACEGIPVPVTDVHGEPVPEERELPRVAGIAGSQPVRVGNAAREQVQVDGAGFVAEAMWTLVASGGRLHRGAFAAVAELADHVAGLAPEPTAGIWEQRRPSMVTSADVGRWLLFDRALKLGRLHAPWAFRRRASWQRSLDQARDCVLEQLLPSGALALERGGTDPDGAGLLLVVLGLLGREDPRSHRLVDATIAALGIGDPVVVLRRYPASVDAGFDGVEAGFVPVSWWAVSALARLDRGDEAHALADRLCEATPGLQPEMLDPEGDGALGNAPLVWSHAEAARALYLLRIADLRRRWGAPGAAAWGLARVARQTVSALQSDGRTSDDQKLTKPF